MKDFEKDMDMFKKITSELSLILWMDKNRKAFKETVPVARETVSIQIQFYTERLETYERKVMPIVDDAMLQIGVLCPSKQSIQDLLEFRDLIKQEVYEVKRVIDALKSLLEIYDKLFYWANKEL